MSTTRFIRAASSIALALAFALPAAAATDAPAATPSMPHDCGKQMAMHDHGADKGMPSPKMAAPCAADPAVAAAAPVKAKAKAKRKAGHDHAKFHKNQ